jgi:hypothetical protein
MTLRRLGIAALFLLVIGIATQIPIPGMQTALVPAPAASTSQDARLTPASIGPLSRRGPTTKSW